MKIKHSKKYKENKSKVKKRNRKYTRPKYEVTKIQKENDDYNAYEYDDYYDELYGY